MAGLEASKPQSLKAEHGLELLILLSQTSQSLGLQAHPTTHSSRPLFTFVLKQSLTEWHLSPQNKNVLVLKLNVHDQKDMVHRGSGLMGDFISYKTKL